MPGEFGSRAGKTLSKRLCKASVFNVNPLFSGAKVRRACTEQYRVAIPVVGYSSLRTIIPQWFYHRRTPRLLLLIAKRKPLYSFWTAFVDKNLSFIPIDLVVIFIYHWLLTETSCSTQKTIHWSLSSSTSSIIHWDSITYSLADRMT